MTCRRTVSGREALGQADQPTDPHRYIWRPVPAGDANVPPLAVRLLRTVA
ncbi:hypothetical protein AB0G05_38860 [Nonomuraea wenchangensis]